jgi:hypothetical protein
LALSLLTGVLLAVGHLTSLGTFSAAGARDNTQAQLLCESVMSAILAGLLPAEPMAQVPIESIWPADTTAAETLVPADDLPWVCTVEVAQAEVPNMLVLAVTVEQLSDDAIDQASFTLVRWIRDPAVVEAQAQAAADAEAARAAESSSGSSSGGSGSSSSGSSGSGSGGSSG